MLKCLLLEQQSEFSNCANILLQTGITLFPVTIKGVFGGIVFHIYFLKKYKRYIYVVVIKSQQRPKPTVIDPTNKCCLYFQRIYCIKEMDGMRGF